ncbi:MAG: DNA mismatch repair endonuclease MutL [Candidatus Odinarchaeota archaeon]|nr:DNA mismatch repair endonuclease MutL [Candidatus Odinarchaeota archaeon]
MGKIKKLDPITIKRIAAGEVVERPASVVKELIENSLDANAKTIFVDILKGGLKRIKVVDDGEGMTYEDAQLAFERYATSKIRSSEDLFNINTLGFRGEALASIAAVSRVTLITRHKDSDIGTKVVVEGGVIKKVDRVGCQVGTSVTVDDLFFNVPARRKFLKSPMSEFSHIADVVMRYSLLYVDVFFRLTHNSKVILSSPSARDLIEKIYYVYGKDVAEHMVKIDYHNESIKITGYVSKPAVSRATRSAINFFVNGRYVVSSLLYKALKEAYHTILPDDRYPIAVINIEIDPSKVDVNIHPTKREVKFDDEDFIFTTVKTAARDVLLKERLEPDIRERELRVTTPEKSMSVTPSEIKSIPEITQSQLSQIPKSYQTKLVDLAELPSTEPEIKYKLPWKIVGQIAKIFIVAYDDTNLYIIDQHAAHERILFERFYKEYKSEKVQKQELLEPLTIEVGPAEASILKENLDYLVKFGFDISYFGSNTFLVRAVPVILKKTTDKKVILDLIDELFSSGGVKTGRLPPEREIIATIACHSAIRAGEILDFEQMSKLIKELLSEPENPFTCPHGRPTVLTIPFTRLYHLFKRT